MMYSRYMVTGLRSTFIAWFCFFIVFCQDLVCSLGCTCCVVPFHSARAPFKLLYSHGSHWWSLHNQFCVFTSAEVAETNRNSGAAPTPLNPVATNTVMAKTAVRQLPSNHLYIIQTVVYLGEVVAIVLVGWYIWQHRL
jgi:hypothetical protein